MMKNALILTTLLFAFASCKNDNRQTCTKTIGGVAGTDVMETREVCDNNEAAKLEESSSGTTVWTCE